MNRAEQSPEHDPLAPEHDPLATEHDPRVTAPLIVGMGASAGGLEAFQELLAALGDAPNLAIVFVQHLDPTSPSLLAELLAKSTNMEVVELSKRCRLQANTVYVCPPQKQLKLQRGWVRPSATKGARRATGVIDYFFHSIAEDQGQRGVGVILSGSGSDGTLGLKAISDCGGLTFAQHPATANSDAMPRSAATTGVADHVMTPGEIAAELQQYAAHWSELGKQPMQQQLHDEIQAAIPVIADTLKQATDHNFQDYKISTLVRRVQRRMQILKIHTASDYVDFLQHHDSEVKALFRELLIGVTTFFRDPEAFEALSQIVLPKLFAQRAADDCMRIWVAGCANGAEAYTLAILCREAMDKLESPCEVKIFATDIDERALRVARAGAYPVGIEEHVTAERLKRFFFKRGKQYHVAKEIRAMVLFSTHNLISDPPFSRQDLISCRNLLIYLGPHLQKKLVPLFHYALRPSGYLFLGPSENLTSHGELFRPLDVRQRISQRKGTTVGSNASPRLLPPSVPQRELGDRQPDTTVDLTEIRQRIVLDEFAPKSCVINESGKVLNAAANMHKYLTIGDGDFENNIVRMAASGLRLGLRAAITEAKQTRRKVQHQDLSIHDGDQIQQVMLTVQPMPQLGEQEPLFLVVFHDVGLPVSREEITSGSPQLQGPHDPETLLSQMESELETTRRDLDRSLQDMEATNEELKSSNEELLSMNEELQSANEELEASKEEIRVGSDAVARANNDLENLFRSTRIATIFLDSDGNIIRFTPAAKEVYNLITTDVGRRLTDITHRAVRMPKLPQPDELVGAKASAEHEIQTPEGRWFLRRLFPYMRGKQTEGMILTFIDVTEQKRTAMRLETEHQVNRLLVQTDSLEAVIPKILKSICVTLNAQFSALWLPSGDDQTLSCREISIQPGHAGLRKFAKECREKRFPIGQGQPGRVWESLTADTIEDLPGDPDFIRTSAIAAGLVSAVAMPIVMGNECFGVIEVFSKTKFERQQPLLDLLQSIGSEIGKFIRQKRSDENLRIEEARKSAILASALDCIITMDVDGRIVDFNPAAERTFGYSQGQVRGRLLADTIIPEEYRDAHTRGVKRFLRTGESRIVGRRFELVAQRADGERFPVELAISATQARDDSTFFTAYLRDISEQKRHERVMEFIARLHNEMNALQSSQDIMRVAAMRVAEFLQLSHCLLIDMDDEAAIADVFYDHHSEGQSSLCGTYQMTEFVTETERQHLVAGRPVVIDDTADASRPPALVANFSKLGVGAIVNAPGVYHQRLAFLLTAIKPQAYAWRRDEVELLCELGTHIYLRLERARADEARQVSERTLRESESHLRRVINHQLGLVGVIDRDGILVEIDDDSIRIAGLQREQVIGKHFAECAWWTYDDSVAERMRESMQRAFAGEVVRYDVALYAAGTGAPTNRLMIDFMIAPVFNDEGRVEYLIPSGVDISDRYAAEQRLLESERRMSMALKAGNMAAWEWTPEKSIWEPMLYELLGISTDHPASSEQFFEYVHPEDREALHESWQLAIEGKQEYEAEFRIIRPDGEVRWLAAVGSVIRDEQGEVQRMHGLNWDITAQHEFEQSLKEARTQAEAANQSKSTFLANMSHEIRTPMTAILGYTDLIADRIDDDETLEHVRTIRRNGDFLLDIINDILDLSKIEAGKLDVTAQRFAPVALVEDVRSIMDVRAAERGIQLDVEYRGLLPAQIASDPKRLRQILINLVGNAIKFTPEGEVKIIVSFEPQEAGQECKLQFEIVDTGIGISPKQQRRLFQPFSQGNDDVNREFGGTGLGLAISKRLTELLGGEISAESTLGQGSRFCFAVDVGQIEDVDMVSPPQQNETPDLPPTVSDIHLDCHVLVVDDRRDIRYLSRTLLQKAGAEVSEAEDGQVALQVVEQKSHAGTPFDLILLDMQMPRLDGYQTAQRLRRQGFGGPIIALTADAMQGDMTRCIESGCNDYLSKPINIQALTEMVHRFTAGS
ncbi:chemotaxis protein CheB [Roseimaritima ulvae]|uniref:Autoinducer 2 sensor kinase/phosphatase LuxQ n=1 Tax=Roseimaritima ulvae TaxID=980254 RepID=A0A5B9QWM9_9BACT|nr:chemotaxis protein CheB [Roseimaritima ulvae]QEG38371.1 Autoinducer 2 sensor kinase/phosphatase LuxQ [Roseimaritima ulvae]